jgi:hypothetical protein
VPPERILRELIALAARMGVEVRSEPFDLQVIEGKGGLCKVHGQKLVVMDAGLPLLDKIGVVAEALSHFDIEAIYVPPLLRASIERRKRERG